MAEHMHRGPPNMHSGCSSNLAPDVTGRIFDLKTLFHLNRMLAPLITRLWLTWSKSQQVPSGKQPHNYGKSPCLMGKSTISMAIFNSYVKLPEGIQIYTFIYPEWP